MVSSGELDLGVIPARAWDTEGVTSLRAVHAPFLVSSQALMAKIAQGELASELLSGLDEAGVVGLALLPEALRHPFGFGRPLTAPADFAGRTIRAPRSEDSFALLRALGATPTDDPAFNVKVKSGEITGAESSFTLASGLPSPAIVSGNVTPFPKFQTLVDRPQGVEEAR